MTDEELWLYTLCKKNGVSITDIELTRLSRFKQLLLDWNKKINLVSRKNEDIVWKGHITLSLSMLFKIRFRSGMNILDLGTGGGFPGIPLAILLPECSFLLLDSTLKKVTTVQSMADSLGLTNVKTIWGRAEELQRQPTFSRKFDAVVARSVSNLSNLLEWGLPFLKPFSGENIVTEKISIAVPSLITFKGTEIAGEELEAQKSFPLVSLKSVPLIFPGSEEFDNFDKKLIIATTRQHARP
ncbi:MAG: 16S rRNA (guanine(527)-N(7))-methyltransferase RsmG [Bacteroidetes bacterium]|nr:16S rRNA (guanine(527)-N(7))-methyltransferase RsmG [Bacteroidota bacterium]